MGKSENKNIVAPSKFINDPQTHFAKLRIKDEYEVELNGKYVSASKVLAFDATIYLDWLKADPYETITDQ